MFLTNHVLTGVLLGLTIDDPVLLAPTAVASHLALDMVPHFGLQASKGGNFREPSFLVLGSVDFALSIAVTITACIVWPRRTVNILVGTIGAALPDLTYIPVIVFGDRWYRWIPKYHDMIKFLGRIQWYEKPPGLFVEAGWTALMLGLLRLKL